MPPSIVQEVAFTEGGATTNVDLVFPAPCTAGNYVIVWHACRDTRLPLAPTGFLSHPDGPVAAQFSSGDEQDSGRWFARLVETGDSLETSGAIESVVNDLEGTTQNAYAAEVAGVDTLEWGPSTSHETDGTISTDLIELVDEGILFAGVVWFNDNGSVTPAADVTEVHDAPLDGPFHPTSWVGYRIESAGDYAVGGAAVGLTSAGWGIQSLILYGPGVPVEPPTDPGYDPPAPGHAILEIYVHDEDATRWGTATWGDNPPTGTTGIWSGAGWQDVTPQGVNAHVIWGSRRPERGILAQQDAASWTVETYDPDRVLDPGNPDSPWAPQLVTGVPIRISHSASGSVIRTGLIDTIRYRHKAPEYSGQVTATDAIAAMHRADVPEDSSLGDTLPERVLDALIASGIAIGGIPLWPNFGEVPDFPLSPRIEGKATVWDHVRLASEEVLCVAFIDADGGLLIRQWGGPLDRGRVVTYANLEDLETYVSEDGQYSVVYVTNADDTVEIERVAAPLPRYGRIPYTRQDTTIDPEAWADAVLADRAWPGVQYVPGVIWCFDAEDVDYFGSLEIMERLAVLYPGVLEITGRVLGMELWVESRTAERAQWLFRPVLATDGTSSIGIELLVSDQGGDILVDDDTGTEYLEVDA